MKHAQLFVKYRDRHRRRLHLQDRDDWWFKFYPIGRDGSITFKDVVEGFEEIRDSSRCSNYEMELCNLSIEGAVLVTEFERHMLEDG